MRVDGLTPRDWQQLPRSSLCSSVPTQLLIASLLRMAGWTPIDESGQLSLPFVVTLSAADTIILIGLMVILTDRAG